MQSKKMYKRKNVMPYTVDENAQRQGRWSDMILCLTNPVEMFQFLLVVLDWIVYGIASPGTKCDFKKRFRSALCCPVGYLYL